MALAGPPRSHENKLPPRLFITPGLHSPGPMPQSVSYVHQDHEPANLYIRNIIPIRAPAGHSRVQSKPLPGRARTPHPPARPDLFHPTWRYRFSRKFAGTEFYEVGLPVDPRSVRRGPLAPTSSASSRTPATTSSPSGLAAFGRLPSSEARLPSSVGHSRPCARRQPSSSGPPGRPPPSSSDRPPSSASPPDRPRSFSSPPAWPAELWPRSSSPLAELWIRLSSSPLAWPAELWIRLCSSLPAWSGRK